MIQQPVTCAWCQRVIQDGTGEPSHGICEKCLEKQKTEATVKWPITLKWLRNIAGDTRAQADRMEMVISTLETYLHRVDEPRDHALRDLLVAARELCTIAEYFRTIHRPLWDASGFGASQIVEDADAVIARAEEVLQ